MIQYLTDPIICINSALSLSLLWITAHDVYVSNIRHVISSTSVRPTFTKITLKTIVLNPAFFIGLGMGIMYCYYDKIPLVYIMFPHRVM